MVVQKELMMADKKVSLLVGAVPPQFAAVMNVLVVADSPPVQIKVAISQNPLLASIR